MSKYNLQHVLHIVGPFIILFYERPHDFYIHTWDILDYYVWHVEGFCVLEANWLLYLF